MNQWAMLKGGHIQNVITTDRTRSDVQKRHPDFEIVALANVPLDRQREYRYWYERP